MTDVVVEANDDKEETLASIVSESMDATAFQISGIHIENFFLLI